MLMTGKSVCLFCNFFRFVPLSLSENHVLMYSTGAWMLVSNSIAWNSFMDEKV